MRIAFSGTRTGLSDAQKDALAAQLRKLDTRFGIPYEVRHGACKGADTEMVGIAYGIVSAWYIAYPSTVPGTTDPRAVEMSGVVHPPAPPLSRNVAIVTACEVLYACPRGMVEEVRGSGTWHAIRVGRKLGRRIVIIFPDGSVTEEPARE